MFKDHIIICEVNPPSIAYGGQMWRSDAHFDAMRGGNNRISVIVIERDKTFQKRILISFEWKQQKRKLKPPREKKHQLGSSSASDLMFAGSLHLMRATISTI